jgi:hypothetical protein
MPLFPNGPMLFFSSLQDIFNIIVVNFTFSTAFLSQKTVANSILADKQCLNILACLVNVYASALTNETQVSLPDTCTL